MLAEPLPTFPPATTALEVLTRTRSLLSHPGAWTQFHWAAWPDVLRPGGIAISSNGNAPLACRVCLEGALERASGGSQISPVVVESRPLLEANDLLCVLLNRRSVRVWNDDSRRTHADILALLDAAIARLS